MSSQLGCNQKMAKKMAILRRSQSGFKADLWHSTKVAVVGLFVMMAVVFGPPYLQDREAALLPVVRPVTITSIRNVADGVMISAQSEKLRKCNWRQTNFYLGSRKGLNVIITTSPHQDPPRINEVGYLEWGNIFLPGITKESVGMTFADAYHECHWLYLSRSNFWN